MLVFSLFSCVVPDPEKVSSPYNHENQWRGKRVAFLGDSITDKRRVGTTKCYWEYLAEMLGLKPLVYGINGRQMSDIPDQAKQLKKEQGDRTDAIIVFAGTNDYMAGIPIGEWYAETEDETLVGGPQKVMRKHRTFLMEDATFKGRINLVMDYLKTNFPNRQIIFLTPLHRAQARFGDDNIQPEETFANNAGLYIDDYVQAIKEAANVWAVTVIDLNSLSGLFPLNDSHTPFFAHPETDRLHPNAKGHYRMALTLKYQLLALPAGFDE
jgi:lysophospholipase L1-like esterase